MNKRIFVEKKADFQIKSESLVRELQHNLSLSTLKNIRIVQVYDVFDLAEDLFAPAEKHIFSEQVTDHVLDESAVQADLANYAFFAIESLPGQFDQRAASSQEALLLLGSSSDVTVNTAQLYLVNKDIDAAELEAVKNYLLNPVDSRFKDITTGIAKQEFSESDKTIPKLTFFESYGWHVVPNVNGHDTAAIQAAIEAARAETGKPSIICCKTLIGKGSANKEGSHKTHGAPLGADEIEATRKHLGWAYPAFEIPQEIYDAWSSREKGAELEAKWNELFAQYQAKYPAEAAEFVRRMDKKLPDNFDAYVQTALKEVCAKAETIATRKASQNSIEILAKELPELVGGSADLTPSNLTDWSGSVSVTRDKGGNYIHYGVREFGMGAIMNGLALHGGVKPFGATFLMFSEYERNALRMAALMKINPVFVFTHDSIGLGEDGPTHQPVEQTATLRLIPNMDVWRPCDTAESLVAWAEAVKAEDHPSCLIFSRQNLKFQARNEQQLNDIKRGGYVISEAQGNAQAVIIATGSEVELALEAQKALAAQNIAVRVVSMPSTNVFDRQDAAYQAAVLPEGLPRIAVEAGHADGWYKYVGLNGAVVGINRFGESAPAELLFKEFGFTVENVVDTVKSVL